MIDDSRRETGGETTQEANPQNHQDDPNHSTGDGLWIQVAVSDGGGGHHRPPDAVSQGAVFEKGKEGGSGYDQRQRQSRYPKKGLMLDLLP